jgi:hypothetical protein
MKVLTIDFDVLMHSDLRFYNNLIEGGGWYELLKNPLMQSLKIDTKLYGILTLWLLDQLKNKKDLQKNIYFVRSHDRVYDILNNI